ASPRRVRHRRPSPAPTALPPQRVRRQRRRVLPVTLCSRSCRWSQVMLCGSFFLTPARRHISWKPLSKPGRIVAMSPHVPTVHTVNDNGAWCWFQDERALIDPVAGTLLVGSIAAPEGAGGAERAGNVELAVHHLATGATRVVVLHANLEADDHNVPALWIRPDGRYLAMYTKHK